MLNKNLINSKIGLIEEYIEELKKILELDNKKILSDYTKLRTIERDFQLIVDEIIDINIYLIKENKFNPSSDFQSSFEILAKNNILPDSFALKISPIVGLRNKIVHRYEDIDRKFFIEQVKKNYKDFLKYIKIINKYTNKK